MARFMLVVALVAHTLVVPLILAIVARGVMLLI